MSAGMAYERMNNAGAMNVDLLVILNDNEMSISPRWARSLIISPGCFPAASTPGAPASASICSRRRRVELGGAREEHMKGMVTPSTLSRSSASTTSARSTGPLPDALIPTLTNIKKLKGPQFCTHHAQGPGYKAGEAIRSPTTGRA